MRCPRDARRSREGEALVGKQHLNLAALAGFSRLPSESHLQECMFDKTFEHECSMGNLSILCTTDTKSPERADICASGTIPGIGTDLTCVHLKKPDITTKRNQSDRS